MIEMKPIETVYNGYRFRSRLEARWAVFFDAASIKYQYEPEGFEVKIDSEIYRYLPDFYLPDFNLYVEVKPSLTKLLEEQVKIAWMIDFHGPLENGLLVLGQIPKIEDNTFPKFNCYRWHKGVELVLVSFIVKERIFSQKTKIIIEDTGIGTGGEELPGSYGGEDLYLLSKGVGIDYDGFWWSLSDHDVSITSYYLKEYFDKARQARFEFGETPKANLEAA